jgi:hypothetical protein
MMPMLSSRMPMPTPLADFLVPVSLFSGPMAESNRHL